MSDNEFDVFANTEEERKVVEEETKKSKAPGDFLKVKLSTAGKLNAPGVIHVRDYSGKDALSLSMINEDNMLDIIVDVANSVIYEGFDAQYLHEQELEEIMLHIYYNFWGSAITDYPYPYEKEELEKVSGERKQAILDGKEKPRVDIPIKNIETNVINEKFKEPFTLEDKAGKKVTFTLSRLAHTRTANEYIENKYLVKDKEFGPIKELISEKGIEEVMKQIPYDRIKAYNRYMEQRAIDFAVAQQAQTIVKIGSKKYNNLEQQINAYSDVGLHMWKNYSDFVKSLNFGVNPLVKVTSPLTGEEVTRRFLFRLMDFIPSMESQDDAGYVVSYEE